MPIPVISPAQMREWEQATWATGQTEADVIARAGKRIARRARKLTRPGDTILFLAGKGHNGDDTRAAYKQLDGRRAELLEMLLPDTDLLPLEFKLRERPALIVDGLFGIGLNRPLNGDWIKIIQAVNAAGIPILSVDVPSGLNAETGESYGAVIQATVTLTLGAPKTGLLTPAGVGPAGRLEIAEDIGLVPCPFHNLVPGPLQAIVPEDFANWPPMRPVLGHKGTFGHLVVVAGSLGYHGAAVLATRAAQRAQPGLVSLYTPESAYNPVAAQLQAAMVHPWATSFNVPDHCTALLAGPGLAAADLPADIRPTLRRIWRGNPRAMVMDASALAMVVSEPSPKNSLRVLTPHPGEAAELLRSTTENVQANRLASLREISRRYDNCWVVLKGHQTLIGRSEGDVFVNLSGNPHLALGGAGDVLAGFIAGLLAQPALAAQPGLTLRYAVWAHGAAADRLQATRPNWIIEDLAAEIGTVR